MCMQDEIHIFCKPQARGMRSRDIKAESDLVRADWVREEGGCEESAGTVKRPTLHGIFVGPKHITSAE